MVADADALDVETPVEADPRVAVRLPEPKECCFAPAAGHEDLARYGALDAAVAFIERRLGG